MEKEIKSSQIDFSIILPTRNRADLLSDTLQSIGEIDIPDGLEYEVIVIDDGCSDDTTSAVNEAREANPRIYYSSGKGKGASHARNIGMRQARGDIFVFIDDDVSVDKNLIKAYWHLFSTGDERIVQGKVLPREEPDFVPLWLKMEGINHYPCFNPGENVEYVREMVTANAAARRDVFRECGRFSEFLGPGTKAGFGEDTELAVRAIAHGLGIRYLPEAIVYHAVDSARMTREYWRYRQYQHGYYKATERILLNGNRPHLFWPMLKLVRNAVKSQFARFIGDESLVLRCQRRVSAGLGFFAGYLDAKRQRRKWASQKQTLSVCIITQNCVDRLKQAVESVLPIADEIVVVDGGSTDNTEELVRSIDKARYFYHPWPDNFAIQKNYAIDKATGDWVLILDSDETVGPNIRRRIRDLIQSGKHDFYKFPRYWIISTEPLTHVKSKKLYPDFQQRLFRNLPCYRYVESGKVHEGFPPGVKERGKKIRDSHIFHFDYVYNDRKAREEKTRKRDMLAPEKTHINRNNYLFEDAPYPYTLARCREKLW